VGGCAGQVGLTTVAGIAIAITQDAVTRRCGAVGITAGSEGLFDKRNRIDGYLCRIVGELTGSLVAHVHPACQLPRCVRKVVISNQPLSDEAAHSGIVAVYVSGGTTPSGTWGLGIDRPFPGVSS
jgi:hypothetical protein